MPLPHLPAPNRRRHEVPHRPRNPFSPLARALAASSPPHASPEFGRSRSPRSSSTTPAPDLSPRRRRHPSEEPLRHPLVHSASPETCRRCSPDLATFSASPEEKHQQPHGTTHYPAQCHIYPKVQQFVQQKKEAMKETLKNKILEEPVMNENIEDPAGQGLTRFFSNACYSCGEEGHYSQDCTKGSQEYLGNFPTEKAEIDPLEIEELAKIKESGKKKKYPRKSQISADIDLSHDMMKHIHLEGDAVYKGYPFMESGVELWYVEVHLHHVKGVCPKTMGQHFFISRVPRATFFDAVREAAMEAIRQIGEILEARLRHTQEYLSEVRAEMMEMQLTTTMMKLKMDDFKEHIGMFQWN
ncbi:hypothetical protein D1007_44648 [Hordeum vulgare]|nr:hypothetical protein D1007_44648 [Hordeum vulgare]